MKPQREPHQTETMNRIIGLLALLILWTWDAAAADDLTLRVNDSEGRAGERVAVVLRTYDSRPISQGQICLSTALSQGAAEGAGGSPFVALEGALIFSDHGDAVVDASFDGVDEVVVEFLSASATINNSDGPLGVLYFRLDPSLAPGQTFEIGLDTANTFLFDDDGEPVAIEGRGGELEIRAPGSPHLVEIDEGQVGAGGVARLDIETVELFGISRGEMVITYPPSITSEPPTVTSDPRYGDVRLEVAEAEPGRLRVVLWSPDLSFNQVPGALLRLAMPIAVATPAQVATVSFDTSSTFLEGVDGQPLPLTLRDGQLRIFGAPPLFADGFESGDASGWTLVSGGTIVSGAL